MSEATRAYRHLIMKGVRDGNPEGRKDVEELQGHLDGLLPRSGGSISGTIEFQQQDKRPNAPQKNSFAIYLFKNGNGPAQVEILFDSGDPVVLAIHP
jgi:hypothetical protein